MKQKNFCLQFVHNLKFTARYLLQKNEARFIFISKMKQAKPLRPKGLKALCFISSFFTTINFIK